MQTILSENELSVYNLEGKWNDYIGVQKEVISVLRSEEYFKNRDIINLETGMVISLTQKGIKETLGKGKRFQNLPKRVKQQKVATIRYLQSLIRDSKLLQNDVQNYYKIDGDKFAYFISQIVMDNKVHNVRIAVKKKVNSNHFYIHHIDTEKSSELLSPSKKTDNYEIQNF